MTHEEILLCGWKQLGEQYELDGSPFHDYCIGSMHLTADRGNKYQIIQQVGYSIKFDGWLESVGELVFIMRLLKIKA